MSSRNVFWVALLALLAMVASVGAIAPDAQAQADPPEKERQPADPDEDNVPPPAPDDTAPEAEPGETPLKHDPDAGPAGEPAMWRVYTNNQSDIDFLTAGGYDLLEAAGEGYFLIIGEESVAEELRDNGFQVEFDRALDLPAGSAASPNAAASGPTFFGGYRSVVEHYAHLYSVESTYPNLATVIDYGDSWNKINGQADPNELLVICLTNKQAGDCQLNPNSNKPRAVFMAAIHARELQTSEVAWRLIDELTQNYGTDADITHIMDTTEIWIIPVANPDGREIVESGENNPYLQRKNANDTFGNCAVPPTSGNHHGVDLNRNASSPYWGGTGTSSNPCAATYPGTGPASEPEQQALETLFTQLFLDQKGGINTPAPSTTEGTFISIHSFSDLILLPNGPNSVGISPNDPELRALAFRMTHFNGYVAGTGPEILYGTTGTTDDWVYYELGVPSYTYELSPVSGSCSGFTPAYSCIDSILWPLNRDALLYSARVAHTPYLTSRGPSTTSISAPTTLEVGEVLNVSAVVDDNTLGTASGSVGRPTVQAVTAAEYYIDASDVQGGTPVAMTAADGNFNESSETAVAAISTTGLAPGEHTLFVRAQNANGYWGPVLPVYFTLTPGVDDPPVADDQSVSVAINTSVPITLTGSDPEGNPLTYSISSGPSNGTLTGSAPNLTYNPDAGYVGADSFTFTVNDGALTSPNGTVSITVTDPQNGPVFVDDFESNTGWVTNPQGTDQATTGQWERANPQGTNSNGPKQLDSTTSGSNALVTEGTAGSSVGVNDIDNGVTSIWSPLISLPPGTTLDLTFDYYMAHTSNSSSADFFRVSILGNSTQVLLEELGAANNDDGAWQQADIDISAFAGQDIRLLIEAADAANGSIVEAAVDTLSIDATVIVVNDPPTADDQTVSTDEDTAVSITLTGSDPEGDPLTYNVTSGPSDGTLTGNGANRTYTPDPNFNGTDSFTFTVNDGALTSGTATVTITVNPVNDPPTADDQNVTTTEDTAVSVTLTGNDIDGDTLTYNVTNGPSLGSLTGTGANRTYTPNNGATGTDTFTYVTNDGTTNSTPATVTITINEINDPPTADDQTVSTDEDTAVSITLTGSDPEGDPLTYNVTSGPSDGTLTGNGANRTYTPDPNFNGTDSFTFTVNDGALTSGTATVTITVNPVNDPPTADDQNVTTTEDTAVSVTLTGNDIDGDTLTYNVTNGPSLGSLTGTGANRTYTPNNGATGTDTFTYVTNDGTTNSTPATVTITINEINDPPTADDQTVSTDEDTAVSITLTGSDPEGDPLTYNVTSGPSDGTLTGNGANRTYTPDPNFNGTDSFTFTVNDGALTSGTATVTITVNPVNDPPTADDQNVTTTEDTAVSVTLTGNDIDGDTLTYNVTNGPSLGSLTGTGANRTYTPNNGATGTDTFTYVTNDGTTNSTPATVTITITPDFVNGPVFTDDFESDQGWVTNPQGTDQATTGQWERADPEPTNSSGPKQLGTTTSGSNALVTEGTAGSSVGTNDIDNGVTSIWSPLISLPDVATVTLSFDYYLAHTSNSSAGDFLRVSIIGNSTQVVLEELGNGADDDGAWAPATVDISSFGGQDVRLLVEAADGDNGSIVEAAIDTLVISASDGSNTPPTADDQSVMTSEDAAIGITLSGSDFDGDPLTYSIATGPSLGSLSGSGANRTYTPDPGVTGTDTFTFTVNDGTVDSAPATVTVTIMPGGTPGVLFSDDFETEQGWTTNPSGTDPATTGQWERANPQGTNYQGAKQLNNTTSGSNALVTAAAAGSSVGANDIDNGLTSMRSPQIALPSAGTIDLTFNYYLAHTSNSSAADFLRVTIVGSSGSTVLFLESGNGSDDDAAWAAFSGSLNAYAGQSVYFLIEAADGANGSIVEAALDDFEITVS